MNGKNRDCARLSNDSSSLESHLTRSTEELLPNCGIPSNLILTRDDFIPRHAQLNYPFHEQEDAA